jgi:hypothetical protein
MRQVSRPLREGDVFYFLCKHDLFLRFTRVCECSLRARIFLGDKAPFFPTVNPSLNVIKRYKNVVKTFSTAVSKMSRRLNLSSTLF